MRKPVLRERGVIKGGERREGVSDLSGKSGKLNDRKKKGKGS